MKTKKQGLSVGKKNGFTIFMMLSPSVFLLVVISIYPFCWLFRYVCYDYNGFQAYFSGAYNFIRMMSDSQFWQSVVHTFEYAFFKIILIVPLSLLAAVLLNQRIKGSNLFRGIYFMPTVISSAIYSLIFSFIFAVFNGPLNIFLQGLHLIKSPVDWLGDSRFVMTAIIIAAIWGGLGNYMVLFVSGLTSIPSEIYESCKIDGAGGVKTFFYITLPMLSPILKTILLLAITGAFRDYESILVLTNGGPNNRSHVMFSYIYNLMFAPESMPQIGYGTLLSIVAALIIGVVTAIYLYFARRLDDVV